MTTKKVEAVSIDMPLPDLDRVYAKIRTLKTGEFTEEMLKEMFFTGASYGIYTVTEGVPEKIKENLESVSFEGVGEEDMGEIRKELFSELMDDAIERIERAVERRAGSMFEDAFDNAKAEAMITEILKHARNSKKDH